MPALWPANYTTASPRDILLKLYLQTIKFGPIPVEETPLAIESECMPPRQSSHYYSIILRTKPLFTNNPKSNPRFNEVLILFLSFLYCLPHPPWLANFQQPPTEARTTRTYDSNEHPPSQSPDPAQFQK